MAKSEVRTEIKAEVKPINPAETSNVNWAHVRLEIFHRLILNDYPSQPPITEKTFFLALSEIQ